MSLIEIDSQLCTYCKTCIDICPESIYLINEKDKIPGIKHKNYCFKCGHCVAYCPANAIKHDNFNPTEIQEIDHSKLPDYSEISEFLSNRRTIRKYLDKQISKEDLDKIIESTRLAPSAQNYLPAKLIIIQDKEVLSNLISLTINYFEKVIKLLESPLKRNIGKLFLGRIVDDAIKQLPVFKSLISNYREKNIDQVLWDSQTLIIYYADKYIRFAEVNANLALYNSTLTAQSLNVGSVYAGYIVAAAQREKKIAKYLSIPKDHKIFGGLALGYPKYKLKRKIFKHYIPCNWL